jgi:hypothetical protein
MLVRIQRKIAMPVKPAIGVGLAPGGILINAAQPLGNNAQILLFFLPDGPFYLVHHFVGTDHAVLTIPGGWEKNAKGRVGSCSTIPWASNFVSYRVFGNRSCIK